MLLHGGFMELFLQDCEKERKNTVFAIEVWNLKKCYTARNNFDIFQCQWQKQQSNCSKIFIFIA